MYDINQPTTALDNLEKKQKQLSQNFAKNYIASTVEANTKVVDGLNKTSNAITQTETKYISLSQKIRQAKLEAEQLFLAMQKDKSLEGAYFTKVGEVKLYQNQLKALHKDVGNLGHGFINLSDNVAYFGAKLRSHLAWLASGSLLAGALAVPYEYINTLKRIELEMASMKQVNTDLHHSQELTNKATQEFINIANQYAQEVDGVIHSATLWGRAYKDLNTVYALTHASAKLALADNFDMATANRALEATLSQLGWRSENTAQAYAYSMRVVDSWTKIAHNAQVSAQDLAEANERTASAAMLAGASFDFLQAVIATTVRNTGRSGAEIGKYVAA